MDEKKLKPFWAGVQAQQEAVSGFRRRLRWSNTDWGGLGDHYAKLLFIDGIAPSWY